ncbi:MAG TPA: exodeoxyribonuclease VII small subunit [Aeromicrobium sp.]|nr:exodeoxyribonuclease VII small subunit [Aeromicrobium sp.]
MTEQAAGLESLTYEQARDELITIVGRLETGGTTLEESLTLWERGEALADLCNSFLAGATARVAEKTAQTQAEQSQAEQSQPE